MKPIVSKSSRMLVCVWLIAAVVLAIIGVSRDSQAAFHSQAGSAPESFAALFEQVKGAVVNVSTTQTVEGGPQHPFLGPDSPFREFFGDEFFDRFFGGQLPEGRMKTNSLGSGVVIDEEGYILTNSHVVKKADVITVIFQTEKEYEAEVVGLDPKTDLALIKVKPGPEFPKPVPMGDSDELAIGDWVLAIGNPFGLGNTATAGIVSAKGRVIGAGPYDDFIQTDAAINPGNSGGPLFNMKGQVVGINTAIVAQAQGIGFAIPINVARQIVPQLMKSGKVTRGWLGVAIQNTTPELARTFGIPEGQQGVVVTDVVQGGPAEKAGIQRGDVIMEFNNNPVPDAHTLSLTVANTNPQERVPVTILRDGRSRTLQVTIGVLPEEKEEVAEAGPQKEKTGLGMTVQNLTPELARRYGMKGEEAGLMVTGIDPGSSASEAGLQRGDVILEVNRQKVEDIAGYRNALKNVGKGETVLLLVRRDDKTFYVPVKPTG